MVDLNEEKVKAFLYAVKNDYWYQMYIDELPIWGKVGEKEENNYYIYTHKKFDIGYNGKHIVDVNISTEKKELLKVGAKIKFTYEVNWKPSQVVYANRFDKYLDPNFFQHRVSFAFTQRSLMFSFCLSNDQSLTLFVESGFVNKNKNALCNFRYNIPDNFHYLLLLNNVLNLASWHGLPTLA